MLNSYLYTKFIKSVFSLCLLIIHGWLGLLHVLNLLLGQCAVESRPWVAADSPSLRQVGSSQFFKEYPLILNSQTIARFYCNQNRQLRLFKVYRWSRVQSNLVFSCSLTSIYLRNIPKCIQCGPMSPKHEIDILKIYITNKYNIDKFCNTNYPYLQ